MENTSSTGIRKAPSMARSGRRDVAVEGFGQLHDGHFAQVAFVAFQRQLGRAFDDRGVVARKVVFAEQFSDFDLDQFEQLGVVDHVDFVQVHDDVGHTDLARQQDVFARLRHGAVGGRDDEDGAVHLGRAGDHVLDVVGVARGSRRGRSADWRFRTRRARC
jgi:hypothetical protein